MITNKVYPSDLICSDRLGQFWQAPLGLFRRASKHDLRHFTASTLTAEGVADNIISLLTGHKSRELRRYQHLGEDLKRGTVDLIAKTLEDAQRNSKDRNGASSAHLLHTSSKTEKKRTGKDSK